MYFKTEPCFEDHFFVVRKFKALCACQNIATRANCFIFWDLSIRLQNKRQSMYTKPDTYYPAMLPHRSRLLHMYHHQIKTWTGSGVSFALVKNLTAHVHSHEKTWHCSDEQLSSLGDNTATTGDDKSWISVCR